MLYAFAFPGSLVSHILGRGLHKSVHKKGEERRKEEGREEATERGLVSSHCSIKSVGNDQD